MTPTPRYATEKHNPRTQPYFSLIGISSLLLLSTSVAHFFFAPFVFRSTVTAYNTLTPPSPKTSMTSNVSIFYTELFYLVM